jgi:hypothetical protein
LYASLLFMEGFMKLVFGLVGGFDTAHAAAR